MRRIKKSLRRIVVSAIGFPIVILGIILIPLPGPGILVSLLGFFILSLEFEWAGRHFERAKTEIKKIYEKSKRHM